MTTPRRKPVRHAPTLTLIALGIALALPGRGNAASASEAAEIDALRSTVNELLKRVDSLERELASRPSAQTTSARARNDSAPAARAAPAAPAAPTRPSAPMRQSAPASPGGTPSQQAAPGTVKVDELAAERALERTLTAEGALLLRPRQFDLEPYFAYTRRESRLPALVAGGDAIAIRTLAVRRNEFDLGLRLRAGLPFASQVEFDIPYRWVDQSRVAPIGFSGVDARNNTGSSLGDIKLGIAKTLLQEKGLLPDLVGRVTWDTDSGDQEDDGVPLGIGYNELRFGLSALKRQDPLAFTAAVSYETTFEKNALKPGDEFGLTLGVSLAASPDTSLSMALVQSFAQEFEINGNRVDGSDQVNSILALGASSILGRRTLLSVSAGIGLTEESPDYTVFVSLPMRF